MQHLPTFTHGTQNDVSHVLSQINSEIVKISDWLTISKLFLNEEKNKYMFFHNHQTVKTNTNIPELDFSYTGYNN